jgi:hypothetical protein
MSATTVAKQALNDGEFAMAVFEGSGNSPVREAILRDLISVQDVAALPIKLTQHPYRPGISVDLERRFSAHDWASLPKEHLRRLATDNG